MTEYIYGTDEQGGHWLTDTEIVRCKNCAHYNDYHGKCHRPVLVLTNDGLFWTNDDSDILCVGHAEPDGFCAWPKRKAVEE